MSTSHFPCLSRFFVYDSKSWDFWIILIRLASHYIHRFSLILIFPRLKWVHAGREKLFSNKLRFCELFVSYIIKGLCMIQNIHCLKISGKCNYVHYSFSLSVEVFCLWLEKLRSLNYLNPFSKSLYL
jgi:hypothetical protein